MDGNVAQLLAASDGDSPWAGFVGSFPFSLPKGEIIDRCSEMVYFPYKK